MSAPITIHVLHCGQVRVDSALPFREESINPIAFTGIGRSNSHQIWLPVSAYLIEHPKGLVLIDTGWHTAVRTHPIKYLGLLHWLINKPALPEGQAIHEQLAQRGIRPADIDYLVMSHLHSDHASGLKHVQQAKRILVSDLEIQDAQQMPTRYVADMWAGVPLEPFSFSASSYGPKQRSFDLFGDDSLVFVNTPGHTNGLASTLVQNNGQFVLLCADTGYARKSWEQLVMPGVMVNKEETAASLRWVKQQSEQPNCRAVLANHDPEVVPHTIVL